MTMGVLSLIISSIGLMSYLNFSIVIAKDLITFKNLFGMKKQYKIDDVSYTFNGTVIKLIINGKRKKLFYYLLDNCDILQKNLKN